ncbi:tyrosine-type recombinase/integrase [Lysobacter humi (ex Lee et al. 2017)]
MPVQKFTQRWIEAEVLKRRARRVDYFDATYPGLCLRLGPRASCWYYFTRVDGKQHRIKLGEWGATGIAEARRLAATVETQKARGVHPIAEQARERAATAEARTLDRARIVENVASLWSRTHLPGLAPSTVADYRRCLAEFVAEFGLEDIGRVRRGQLVRFLDRVRARSPTAANRTAVVIRLVFAFARDHLDLEVNAAADIKNPAKQVKRKRTLDRTEICVLWHACELAGYPYGHALRFALCTGQRIGEVSAVKRSDIDSTGHYWKQETNKSGRRIDIYLADLARSVLDECPDLGRTAPFFSASIDVHGRPRPLRSDGWNNAIRRHITPRIEQAALSLQLDPITHPWTPHDLRRTVRTALTGWCGVSPDAAERVLNHALTGLREVYDHADYRPHVADALARWDAELRRITQPKGRLEPLPSR